MINFFKSIIYFENKIYTIKDIQYKQIKKLKSKL